MIVSMLKETQRVDAISLWLKLAEQLKTSTGAQEYECEISQMFVAPKAFGNRHHKQNVSEL